ncbi:MAG: DNA adenine methylase [Anaerolineae bacterium]|nr:DNA adenine methylase [Anaerolineae bacterium]
MSDDDHRELAAMLKALKGMVILSGYDSPLYRELFPDWRTLSRGATTNGNSTSTEYLWISPNTDALWAKYRSEPINLPLFDSEAVQP